jgi:hypothetical protein
MRTPLRRSVCLACSRVALPLAVLTSGSLVHAQGLEPPPPIPGYPAQPPTTTGYQSAQSDEEKQDSGLGLEWVWLNAEAGISYVNMQSFDSSNLGLKSTSAGGPSFGVGAGVRLIFFTLGVRARDLLLSDIGSLWMLNLEAAFHTRFGRVDPYFGVRGGYNFVGSLSSDSLQTASGGTPPGVDVHGWNVGPIFGMDFYPTKLLSVGFDLDSQFLFLQRPAPALPCPAGLSQSQCQAALMSGSSMIPASYQQQYQAFKFLYDNQGSSVGFGFTAMAHLGVHF